MGRQSMGFSTLLLVGLFALPVLLRGGANADTKPLAGWAATFSGGGSDAQDLRTHVPAAALALYKGESTYPTLGVENNVAVFEGDVYIPTPGRWRFALRVDGGDATLMLLGEDGLTRLTRSTSGAGRTDTDWIELEAGILRINVLFKRRGIARTRLRTLWAFDGENGDSFALEPIPTRVVFVPDELRDDVGVSLEARTGRVLLERKGCNRCHVPNAEDVDHVGSREGPDLSDVGARLGAEWMRRWIADPASMRPGADMPTLLGEGDQDVLEDLVQFLVSLTGETEFDSGALATEPAIHRRGRALYHSIGCVACHGSLESAAEVLADPYLAGDLPSEAAPAPFGDLTGKWRPSSLASFLRDPASLRPDGMMPDLSLSAPEADDISTYLLGLWGAVDGGLTPSSDSINRGRKQFAAMGCVACHHLDDVPAHLFHNPLRELDPAGGCMDPNATDSPRFDLAAGERAALAAGLAEVRAGTAHPSPLDRAERVLANYRCLACHSMEGRGGVKEEERVFFRALDERTDLGDEGRLPPDLSGVGFRLTTQWMRDLFLEEARSRPYMATRMPVFPDHVVEEMAGLLGRREGLWPDGDLHAPPVTDAAVLAGRRLMDTQDGLACESCHVHGDLPPAGSPGLAMTAFAERLRYEWFQAFMPNPSRFKPGTRMPSFSTNGVSAETSILDGDAARQQEAMWAYFSLGEFMPPPRDAAASDTMVLAVGSRPRVFRSFLRDAGSRGIAVGFPLGIHLAFDASTCRLAEVWQGPFLNAAGSWAGRGGTELGGQGLVIWSGGERPLFEFEGAEDVRFRGYRLDSGGTPSFLYTVGQMSVEDRMVPRVGERTTLERTLVLRDAPPVLLLYPNGDDAELGAATCEGAEIFTLDGEPDALEVRVTASPAQPVVIHLEVFL
jgi:cbb3-type cytochrome oxidase cytochrome c subunit